MAPEGQTRLPAVSAQNHAQENTPARPTQPAAAAARSEWRAAERPRLCDTIPVPAQSRHRIRIHDAYARVQLSGLNPILEEKGKIAVFYFSSIVETVDVVNRILFMIRCSRFEECSRYSHIHIYRERIRQLESGVESDSVIPDVAVASGVTESDSTPNQKFFRALSCYGGFPRHAEKVSKWKLHDTLLETWCSKFLFQLIQFCAREIACGPK